MSHVVKLIGGLESQQVHIGQQGMRFKTVPKAKQAEALQFLREQRVHRAGVHDQDRRAAPHPAGAARSIACARRRAAVLTALLQNQRIDRMTEQLTIDGADGRVCAAAVPDWTCAPASGPSSAKPGTAISIYRRNLQRAYLDNLDQKLNGTPAASAEIRMLVKGELQRARPAACRRQWPRPASTRTRAGTWSIRAMKSRSFSIRGCRDRRRILPPRRPADAGGEGCDEVRTSEVEVRRSATCRATEPS